MKQAMKIVLGTMILGCSIAPAIASTIIAQGDTQCDRGRDCNHCVHNVEQSFDGLQSDPSARISLWSGAGRTFPGMPEPMNPLTREGNSTAIHEGHIQGQSRLSGIVDQTWMVVSLSTRKKSMPRSPAGLMFYRLSELSTQRPRVGLGAPFSDTTNPDRYWIAGQRPAGPKPSTAQAPKRFHRMPETKHPGGLQTIGRIVAVASYCDGENDDRCKGWNQGGDTPPYWGDRAHAGRNAYVDFIEVTPSPENANDIQIETLGRLLLGDIGSFLNPYLQQNKAFYLSIAKMANGHYVLMVNRSDHQHMQFFVSTTKSFTKDMNWTYKGYKDWSVPDGDYQNAYFITECGTGQLYWLAFMQQDYPRGDSWADLYKVRTDDGKLNVDFVHNERLDESNDACEAKAGAGTYVTPLGGLVIYCSQARSVEENRTDQDPELLNFTEFVAPHKPSCGQGYIHAGEFCDHGPNDREVTPRTPNRRHTDSTDAAAARDN